MTENDLKTINVLRKMNQNSNISREQSDALDTAIIKMHMSKTIFQMNHDYKEKSDDRTKWYQALMLLKDRIPNRVLTDLFYLGEEMSDLIKDLNHTEDCDLNKWCDVWSERKYDRS